MPNKYFALPNANHQRNPNRSSEISNSPPNLSANEAPDIIIEEIQNISNILLKNEMRKANKADFS